MTSDSLRVEKTEAHSLPYPQFSAGQNVSLSYIQVSMPDFQKISHTDSAYPAQLKEIHDAPKEFFIWGNPEILHKPSIAIVGTRRNSAYGKEVAHKLAADLASMGIIIVSGMALGIDTAAHEGALSIGGITIGVIGSGLDKKSFYPSENYALAQQIIEHGGAILSEYKEGTPALAHHFPLRNRIVSGLSLGVAVIEAKEKSGALITAQCALDQNREVFAVPGPINHLNSQGPNKLIQKGAKLITGAHDIIEEFPQFSSLIQEESETNANLSEEEKTALDALSHEALSADALSKKLNKPLTDLLSCLSLLELKGYITNNKGTYQSKIK